MDHADAALVRLELPAQAGHLHIVAAVIGALLEPLDDLPERAALRDGLQLAAHEVCANIVRHAYAGRADGRIALALRLEQQPRGLVIELRDTGRAFDPALLHEPDISTLPTGGYGTLLVRKLMDEVSYTAGPEGNRWRLVKRF